MNTHIPDQSLNTPHALRLLLLRCRRKKDARSPLSSSAAASHVGSRFGSKPNRPQRHVWPVAPLRLRFRFHGASAEAIKLIPKQKSSEQSDR